MKSLLSEWGCEVILAANKAQAIQSLLPIESTPTALLVDRHLGSNEDGISVIAQLREELNEPVPAILITGEISGFQSSLSETNIQVMTKPVDPAVLFEAIAGLR